MTDPGEYHSLYDELPNDIAGICRVIQGLVIHYNTLGYSTPADRMSEVDTRYVSKMLKHLLELDNRPLDHARAMEQRFIGCCRDFTVLTVSILRSKGIPARARYGTAAYFETGWYHDHAIVEYWNGSDWIGVDAQLSSFYLEHYGISIDPLNIREDQFLRGGRGWLMCHKEGANSDRFGLGSQSPIRGIQITLGELLLDLAALNRIELLCWDSWGYSTRLNTLSAQDMDLLDQVAASTLDNQQFSHWQSYFQNEHLTVPNVIFSFSPALNPVDMPAHISLNV